MTTNAVGGSDLDSEGDGWDFDLGETVLLLWSPGLEGMVIARKEHLHEDTKYLVRYTTADDRLVEQWLDSTPLDHVQVN